MPKGVANKRHTGEFKQEVVEYILQHGVSCHEAGRVFDTDHKNVELWERIYLSEGMDGLYQERRGRKVKGLPKNVQEDLLAENQRLRAEVDYLKKLNALVFEEERQNRKRK